MLAAKTELTSRLPMISSTKGNAEALIRLAANTEDQGLWLSHSSPEDLEALIIPDYIVNVTMTSRCEDVLKQGTNFYGLQTHLKRLPCRNTKPQEYTIKNLKEKLT